MQASEHIQGILKTLPQKPGCYLMKNAEGTIIYVGKAVNLRAEPRLDSELLGLLEIGQTAETIGRSDDGLWYLIKIPSQPTQNAWVYASLVNYTY